MRSPWSLSDGRSRRSTFTTTVCGASFSKSWMPIETCRRKSRMKIRRSMGEAMSVLLSVEGDVARPAGQMLAAVDDQGVSREARRLQDEAQRTHEVVRADADTQRVGPVL